MRDGLLYATGGELASAVGALLTAAGFEVHDLDAELGGPKSADLLATQGPTRCLVEVKSAGGNAGEGLVSDLQRHVSTWTSLRPEQQPVTHAALVVSHQCRRPPCERSSQVYSRPEFVSALPFPVISALQLFDWWRTADWAAIRVAMMASGPLNPPTGTPLASPQAQNGLGREPFLGPLLRWRRKTEG
jgi:hypothetical protein